jgi:hypothetical protein
MTGSSLAPIIIPIAGTISLAVWLIMVLSADRHRHTTAGSPGHTGDSPSPATLDDRHQPSTGQVVPAAPAGTGSCPNTSTRTLPGAGDLRPSRRPRGSGQKGPGGSRGRRARRAHSRPPAHGWHPHRRRREVLGK